MTRTVFFRRLSAVVAALSLLPALRAWGAAAPLPNYEPDSMAKGVIKVYGGTLLGNVVAWEKAFERIQPGVTFVNSFRSDDGWTAGMEADDDDIGAAGREPALTEYLSFDETFGYNPTEIKVATGAYGTVGASWALVIFVNKNNPITHLTMQQVDDIFGSGRTGAFKTYKWMPQYGRPDSENIRTWGQLGLTGKWANKEIQTYGYADTGMRHFFELKVFHDGDKWNPNYREYVESNTKEVSSRPGSMAGTSQYMLKQLAKDPYGIAWSGLGQAADVPGIKPLALASKDGDRYVLPTKETVQNRTYPLTRSVFMYLNRAPGKPLKPQVRDFMRFVLSRQGQEVVRQLGVYLPLTSSVVQSERKKLN